MKRSQIKKASYLACFFNLSEPTNLFFTINYFLLFSKESDAREPSSNHYPFLQIAK